MAWGEWPHAVCLFPGALFILTIMPSWSYSMQLQTGWWMALSNTVHQPALNSWIPIPILRLILQENSFQFFGKNYLQTHGTSMGTKIAVAFANIYLWAELKQTFFEAKRNQTWKRYIDDICFLWNTNRHQHQLSSLNKQIIIIASENYFHGWNFRYRNYFPGHQRLQRQKTHIQISVGHTHPLQAHWNISVNLLLLVSPTKS